MWVGMFQFSFTVEHMTLQKNISLQEYSIKLDLSVFLQIIKWVC